MLNIHCYYYGLQGWQRHSRYFVAALGQHEAIALLPWDSPSPHEAVSAQDMRLLDNAMGLLDQNIGIGIGPMERMNQLIDGLAGDETARIGQLAGRGRAVYGVRGTFGFDQAVAVAGLDGLAAGHGGLGSLADLVKLNAQQNLVSRVRRGRWLPGSDHVRRLFTLARFAVEAGQPVTRWPRCRRPTRSAVAPAMTCPASPRSTPKASTPASTPTSAA